MADKKEFRPGVYAIIAGVVMAVVLAGITIYAYTSRYTAFSPEKVAVAYVDTIVQTGDGYNAYKNSLVCKNIKHGDFIINGYMKPYVNDKDIEQAAFVGTGSEEEQKAIDTVYDSMYTYYCELIKLYGWDNYDTVFSKYFERLAEVRKEVYKDEFMDTEYMFGALEANVDKYGKDLTGVEGQEAKQGQAEIKEQIGIYQRKYGDDYKLVTSVVSCDELGEAETTDYIEHLKGRLSAVAASGEEKAAGFGLEGEDKEAMVEAFKKLDCAEDVKAVAKVTCKVEDQNGNELATQDLFVVKIGRSWYVDNTNIDTEALYKLGDYMN